MTMPEPWSRLWRRQGSGRLVGRRLESGASAVEYGLLIAGIAAIIAVAVFAFGGGATGMFQDSCKTIFADHSAGSCS
jgi:pilus assembly protein Flp/PilA